MTSHADKKFDTKMTQLGCTLWYWSIYLSISICMHICIMFMYLDFVQKVNGVSFTIFFPYPYPILSAFRIWAQLMEPSLEVYDWNHMSHLAWCYMGGWCWEFGVIMSYLGMYATYERPSKLSIVGNSQIKTLIPGAKEQTCLFDFWSWRHLRWMCQTCKNILYKINTPQTFESQRQWAKRWPNDGHFLLVFESFAGKKLFIFVAVAAAAFHFHV